MTVKNKFYVALDMTGPYSAWSIADEHKNIIAENTIKISRKSNSIFFDSLLKKLKKLSIPANEIESWYVGVGPGSYTGVRVGAAFVSGINFCNECNVVGVPSYFPIAAELFSEGVGNVGVVFQVTNKSVLVYNVVKVNGSLESDEEPVQFDMDNSTGLAENYDKLVSVQDLTVHELFKDGLESELTVLDSFPVRRMFDLECNNHSRNIDDLIYTRPAVTTKK